MGQGYYFLLPQASLLPIIQITLFLLQTPWCLLLSPCTVFLRSPLSPYPILNLHAEVISVPLYLHFSWPRSLCNSFQQAACLCPQNKCLLQQFTPISWPYVFRCEKISRKGLWWGGGVGCHIPLFKKVENFKKISLWEGYLAWKISFKCWEIHWNDLLQKEMQEMRAISGTPTLWLK